MWNQVGVTLEESMARVLSRLAALLPGIFAFLVAVLLFTLLGWLFYWIVQKLLVTLHVDERFGRGSEAVSDWSPNQTPTRLIAGLVFWFFLVLGIAVGIDAFGASSNPLIAAGILAYLPKLVGAAVILLVGNIVARFLYRSVLIGAVNMNLQYARVLGLGVKWLVLVLTAAMVLDHLRIGEEIVDLAFGILDPEKRVAAVAGEGSPEEQVRHF
jgi:hypothetical protein